MRYKYIIFDFDGTLFDSRVGIVGGVKHALDAMSIEYPSEEVLTSFIGPPLGHSFRTHFNLNDDDTQFAVKKLREYYDEIGALQAKPYDGILELLQELNQGKKKIGIATAKPTVYANKILESNAWTKHFQSVRGSELKGELFPKELTISQVLEDFSVFNKEKCIMVGDTIYDIKGAQHHQIDSVAVNYGYGKTQDLKDVGPTYFLERVAELREILLD